MFSFFSAKLEIFNIIILALLINDFPVHNFVITIIITEVLDVSEFFGRLSWLEYYIMLLGVEAGDYCAELSVAKAAPIGVDLPLPLTIT